MISSTQSLSLVVMVSQPHSQDCERNKTSATMTPVMPSSPCSDSEPSSGMMTPETPSTVLDQCVLTSEPTIELVSQVTIPNPETGPPVKIDVRVIERSTGKTIRYAGVEFHKEGSNTDGDARTISKAQLNTEVEFDVWEDTHMLNFEYTNAVVTGVDLIPDDWPHNIKDKLLDLRKYREDGKASLKLDTKKEELEEELAKLLKYLNSDLPRELLKDCRAEGDDLNACTGWDKLMEEYGLVEDSSEDSWDDDSDHCEAPAAHKRILTVSAPVVTAPAAYHFSSPEEAQLKLAHARFTDWVWETIVSQDLCKGSFKAAFVVTGPGAVIACIKRKYDGIRNPRAALDEHKIISIVLPYGTDLRDIEAQGQITSNHVDIECDYCVLLDKVPRQIFRDATRIGGTPRFMSVRVRITANEHDAQKQVSGINKLFSRSGGYKGWWDVFMAQSLGQNRNSNFLKDELGVTQTQIDEVVDQVMKKLGGCGIILNNQQEHIFRDIGTSHSGWTLLRGPPGTGKSTLIAMLIDAYLRFDGVGVYACAPSNGAVDRLSAAILQQYKRTQPPRITHEYLRVLRKGLEMQYLWDILDPKGKAKKARDTRDIASGVLQGGPVSKVGVSLRRQQDANIKRLMDNPEHSVMAAVLQAATTGNLREMPEARLQPVPKPEGAVVTSSDVRQTDFQNALEPVKVLKDHLVRARGVHRPEWSFSQKKQLERQAVEYVRRQIVGTYRLIVSTIGNAMSTMINDRAFRDCKAVVIIVDEESLDTDPGTLSLLTGLINEERTEFGGSSPVVQFILVGDKNQGAPVVKSEQDNANVFGPQLALSTFERLVKAGLPVETLLEQYRMVPLLRKLPSERCYSGQLYDSAETKSRRLNQNQEVSLKQYFDIDFPKIKPEVDEVVHNNANQQFLRHMLLNVPNSKAEIEKTTKSRFNMGNIEVTFKFVKFLIQQKVVAANEIVILVLYNAQKRRYIHRLADLEEELGLKDGELDGLIETSNSFQGRERRCAILDLVTTTYAGPGSMGHVSNERKMNVACSRAQNFFFVVANLNILQAADLTDEEGRMEYALDLLTRLRRRKAYKNFYCSVSESGEMGVVGEEEAQGDDRLVKGGDKGKCAMATAVTDLQELEFR